MKIHLSTIFLFLAFGATAMSQDDEPQYQLPGGNYSVFFIDSVQVDNYCVVESGINHHLFLVPDSNYHSPSKTVTFWENENCIFFWEDYYLLRDFMCVFSDGKVINEFLKRWPYEVRLTRYVRHNRKNKKDKICPFIREKPTLFARFLMTGSAYDYVFCGICLDCITPERISFINPNAYYMIYVPIR